MLYIKKGNRYLPAAQYQISEAHVAFVRESFQKGKLIGSPGDTREFLMAELQLEEREVFACVFLDNRHRVIEFNRLFFGTIDAASVYPREVIKAALKVNAAAVILAHNHPSGVAEPSQSDQLITRRIREALELVDIRLLDHFIVGGTTCVSLASRGML